MTKNQIFRSNGTTIQVRLTDVEVAEDGLIHVLDFTSGRVFQYDPDCNLLFIFGASRDNQQGAFSAPNAIESSGDYVYVLDGRKNDVTVFKKTVFGQCVHDAVELFNKGLYTEAIGPWEEVIKRDGNYNLAYEGIAKARYYQAITRARWNTLRLPLTRRYMTEPIRVTVTNIKRKFHYGCRYNTSCHSSDLSLRTA